MSIVRKGLAEDPKFAEGYDAIFGKKKEAEEAPAKAKTGKAPKAAKKAGTKGKKK